MHNQPQITGAHIDQLVAHFRASILEFMFLPTFPSMQVLGPEEAVTSPLPLLKKTARKPTQANAFALHHPSGLLFHLSRRPSVLEQGDTMTDVRPSSFVPAAVSTYPLRRMMLRTDQHPITRHRRHKFREYDSYGCLVAFSAAPVFRGAFLLLR